MRLNRCHLFMPIYVIIALTTSFVAYGQPPVKFKEKTGEKIEVPVDIVKIIKTMDILIQDLGGYQALSEAIPAPDALSTAQFKKIITILSAAKKTLGIDDLTTASEEKLQDAVEKNFLVASPNVLFEILNAANFLDVKSILNAGAKIFGKNFSDVKSNFHSLIPEIRQLIIQNISPEQFLALVKANPLGVNSPEEEELFRIALKITGAIAPKGKTAKEYYEANWRFFLQVGACYHLKVFCDAHEFFLDSKGSFYYKDAARVCVVGNLPDKIGFKIYTDSGEKFLSASADGSVKFMPSFSKSETFSITDYNGRPVIKTAHDEYLMVFGPMVESGGACWASLKQTKSGKEISEPMDIPSSYAKRNYTKFIEFVPLK